MQPDHSANDPIANSPFLTTAPAVDALHRLERGLGARRPFLLVTGDSGLGKTTLAGEALRRMADRITAAVLDSGTLAAGSLPASLIEAFGGAIESGAHALLVQARLLETLANATAGGRVAVLVLDRAERLGDATLVELQRVTALAAQRQCPLEVMLVAAPELVARFESGPLASLDADISVRVAMAPLSAHDTRHYLLQRPAVVGQAGPLVFSRKACRDIHTETGGVVRDIEALAFEAAQHALRSGVTTISPEHVRAAAPSVRSARAEEPVSALTARPAARPERAEVPPAEAPEPQPAEGVAQGSHVDALESATAAAPMPADAGEFRPSDDPRVKDWLSRFGGAGVRIGANYLPSGTRGSDSGDDGVGEVRPLGAGETSVSKRPLVAADFEPEATSSTLPPARAPLPDANGPAAWPPRRAHPRAAGMRGPRRELSFLWPAATLLLGMAIGALLIGQRSLLRGQGDESASVLPAPMDSSLARAVPGPTSPRPRRARAARIARQASSEPSRVTTVRYAVTVGTFLNAEMARAEREHLARLIAHRVWVTTSDVNGVTTYRIQLGTFASRDDAEAAAQQLLRQGLLRDAHVVELPASP